MYSKTYTTCFLFCGKPSNTISQPQVLQSIYPLKVVNSTEVCMFHNLATAQPNHTIKATQVYISTFYMLAHHILRSSHAHTHNETSKLHITFTERPSPLSVRLQINPPEKPSSKHQYIHKTKKVQLQRHNPQTKDLVKDCHCESVLQSKATLCSQAALCSPLTRVSLRARPHFAHHSRRMSLRVRPHFAHHSQECPSEQGHTLLTTHKGCPSE